MGDKIVPGHKVSASEAKSYYFLVHRLTGCGVWFTVISFALSLLWVCFHEWLDQLAPHTSVLVNEILLRIIVTTVMIFSASYLFNTFWHTRTEAEDTRPDSEAKS